MRPVWIDPSCIPDEITLEAIKNMQKFNWNKTWTFWPRRDRITKRRMRMFSTVYKGTRVIHGPGQDLILVRWLSAESFMFERLRGAV